MSQDFLSFIQAPEEPVSTSALPSWKLAVIDDDQAVHDGTRFALQNFSLNGRRIDLIGATSGREGLQLLREHTDTAVVLLDVVMETRARG